MWTRRFWKAALERMIRAGAAGVLAVWIVGDGFMNAFDVDWQNALGVFAGSAVVSLLLSLAGSTVSGNGPAFNSDEQVVPGK